MDRVRPVHVRHTSSSSSTGSPAMSPLHRGSRSVSAAANARRGHNNATKAAAQKLARVMAHQSVEEEDDDDDGLDFDYSPTSTGGGIGLALPRPARSQSPLPTRTALEPPLSTRSASGGRPSLGANAREQPSSACSTPGGRYPQNVNSAEQAPSAHSNVQPSQSINSTEQPLGGRSAPAVRSSSRIKPIMVPPSVPISLRPTAPASPMAPPPDYLKERRLSMDMGSLKDFSNQRSASVLQDELDMLQEENENLVEKLRLAEERCDGAETRVKQLEKQVATLGEGVSMEACLLSKKEAALQQREAALKVVEKTHGGRNEKAATLRMEAESARDEATSALEQLHDAEYEIKSLRAMTQRIMLTHEEMEEVVLKRCWLSYYWSLCVQHGIHADVATEKYEFWSSFAPHPLEVVLAAGERAREENSSEKADAQEKGKTSCDLDGHDGEKSIESMLLVEKGLRELVSLKVEDALTLAMAQKRRPNALKSDELKLPTEGHFEVFELSQEEWEDVKFKQAWLRYFWRRAREEEVESEVAEERVQFWSHNVSATATPTSHDAVDGSLLPYLGIEGCWDLNFCRYFAVARGLAELRKLGIETQLWEASRK